MKLLTTMINSFKCKRTVLLILLFVGTQGNTETECEATEGMTLKCKFPKNMQSTETDFLIYFYPDDGKTELLADCWWNNKELVCILQDSMEIKHPVSDIAVISLPPRVVSIRGTYKCIPDGDNSENSQACQFHKSHKEGEEIRDKSENGVHLQKPVESLTVKDHDQKEAETSTSFNAGAVLGSVLAILLVLFSVLVLYNKFSQKKLSTPKAGSSLYLDKLRKSPKNKKTDRVSDIQLSRGSLLVSSQQESSAARHEEDKPLLQSENNENVAIRDATHNEEYSYTVRSSLELKYSSCEGFVRENDFSTERF